MTVVTREEAAEIVAGIILPTRAESKQSKSMTYNDDSIMPTNSVRNSFFKEEV